MPHYAPVYGTLIAFATEGSGMDQNVVPGLLVPPLGQLVGKDTLTFQRPA
jgi:hypothetical protein